MLLTLTYHLTQARAHIDSALKHIQEGGIIEYEDAVLLNKLLRSIEELRNQAIRHDILQGESVSDVADKYELSPARISQIANKEASEILSNSINVHSGKRVLELGMAALIDVRGVRIVESLRQKIAKAGMGVTVQGTSIAVRFGEGKSLQQVLMQVVSVIDSEVLEEE